MSLKRLNFYYEDSLFLEVCQALGQCRRVKKAGQQWKVPCGFRAPSLDALSETGTRYETTAQESVWALLLLILIGQEIFSAQSDAENSHSKGKCPLNIPSPISAPSCSKMYLLTAKFRCRNLHTHFTLKKFSASQSNESFFALVFP